MQSIVSLHSCHSAAAYAAGSALLAQERLGERSPDEVLAALFERNGADYVHIRNGEVGCFMARVERQPVQHQRTGIVLR